MQQGKAGRLRRRLVALARAGAAALLLGVLVRRTGTAGLLDALRGATGHAGLLLSGTGLLFLSLCAGMLRWRLLLRAEGLDLPAPRVFRFFFVGQFFNAFLLGACGGDMARAYLVARERPGRRAEAVSTVLVDRATGLVVMILFCGAMVAARWSVFGAAPGIRAPGLLLLALPAACALGLWAFFRRDVFAGRPALDRWSRRHALPLHARHLYDALFRYRGRARLAPPAVGYSLLSLLLLTGSCVAFGRALGLALPLRDYFTFFPVVNLVAAVPLTPGGLGVREQMAVALFGAAGVDPERAMLLSLLGYAAGAVWSLFGGVLLVAHAAAAGRGWREEVAALRADLPARGEPAAPGR